MSNCIHCGAALPEDALHCPECGQAQVPAAAPLPTLGAMNTIGDRATDPSFRPHTPELAVGDRFADRYTVRGLLGAGGMGVVYRAEDSVSGEEVALKLIVPRSGGFRGDDAEIRRLVQEGITARGVRHPNVVAVYDVGEHDGTPFLSMEVVDGISLRGWIRERAAKGEDVPAASAVAIVRAIAEGIRAAHARGVVHRDLKPENVVLETPPRGAEVSLKVLDFGIARAGRGTSAESGTGSGVGTPRYMAPEQVTNADLAGPSADVYSLSVMLYELLVGVLPQGHWQPPSEGRSDVPRGLDQLVQEGLSNRPQSRPATMESFLERLDALDDASLFGSGKRVIEELEAHRTKWRAALLSSWTPAWTRALLVVGALLVAGAVADELGAFDEDPALASFEHEDAHGWNEPTPPAWDGVDLDHGDPEETGALPDDLSTLSGAWEFATGHAFDVTVSRLGRVRGQGTVLFDDGFNVAELEATLRGRIKDGRLTYDLKMDGQTFAEGEGAWIGGAEFTVQHSSPDGIPLEANVILVNGGRGF